MISVILPAFNRCEYLKPTLMALSSQKVSTTVEIIVVDSGCDNTSEMIDQFFPDVVYSRLPQQRNRSLVRNEGARIATGEYLIFIDNDMIVTPGYLEAHYCLLSSQPNSVALSKRLSLSAFDAKSYPLDQFSSDLEFLKRFPGNIDVRDTDLAERESSPIKLKEGWVFCFSHGLSMSKEIFEKSGGFDVDFGENWGLEDVELGYRLAKNGAIFFVLEEALAYHQPHDDQNSNNLVEVEVNQDIFLEKHPYSDVEIVIRYSPFHFILDDALTVRDTYMSNFNMEKNYDEDLILGYLFSYNQDHDRKRFKLGIYLPKDFKKVNKARIIKESFYYEELILLDIFKNALDYSKIVIVEKRDENTSSQISGLLNILGYIADKEELEQHFVLHKTGEVQNKIIRLFMPPMDQPRQRHFNYSLALLLRENGFMVTILDHDYKEDSFCEDFIFNEEENEILSYMFKMKYRQHDGQILVSKDELLHFGIKLTPGSLIMDDLGYSEFYKKLSAEEVDNEKKLKIISTEQLDLIALSIAVSRVSYEEKKRDPQSFLLFMLNGFYEDSIDIVLEGFSRIVKDFKDTKLIVKVFDYYFSFQNTGIEFNNVTKEHSYYLNKERYLFDLNRLKATVFDLNLEKNIEIIENPLTLEERKLLYKESDGIISLSKDHFIGIEAYESLFSGNSFIVGDHKIMHREISNSSSVYKVSSQRSFYAEAMHRPFSAELSNYSAYEPNLDSLEKQFRDILRNKKNKRSEIKLPEEIRNSKYLLKDF